MKKQKEKDLRFILLFIIIVSCCLLYLFQSSYAKYRKQINGQVDAEIASWNIKVNEEDIANKKVITNTIEPVFPNDDNTTNGKIAPGIEGYYMITIDATEVDVPFQCKIQSEAPEESSVTDLKTLSYEINPTTIKNKLEYNNDTGIIQNIEKNTKKTTIKIYLTWDDETGTMNNQTDTNVATNPDSQALMDVVIHFNQLNN